MGIVSTLKTKMKALRSNYFTRFEVQMFARFCTSAKSLKQKDFPKPNNTIDVRDVEHHTKQSAIWWNPHGKMRALHRMNPLRIQFVRDGLANAGFQETSASRPLEGIKLLDVGCGGGILSEPLAKIGADVTGLDASEELIRIAKNHSKCDKELSSNLKYVNSLIEDFSRENKEAFDVVVASEIIEHVMNPELFVKSCSEVLKPKGSIFITTFNRTTLSWVAGIVLAEHLLRILPVGTHDWNKFITPDETKQLVEKFDCKTKLIHGLIFNPMTNTWSWTSSTAVNYGLHAVKTETALKAN